MFKLPFINRFKYSELKAKYKLALADYEDCYNSYTTHLLNNQKLTEALAKAERVNKKLQEENNRLFHRVEKAEKEASQLKDKYLRKRDDKGRFIKDVKKTKAVNENEASVH